MHVLIAPDALGASLGAGPAAAALAAGWSRGAPHDSVETCPLSAGGLGFVGLVGDAVGVLPEPDGVLLVPGTLGTITAYIDAYRGIDTDRSGAVLARAIEHALSAGAARVVVGLPGPHEASGVPDAGAGLLAALGALVPGRMPASDGPSQRCEERLSTRLGAVTTADLSGLAAVRERLRGVDLVGATATDVPLLGLHGASASAAAAGVLGAADAHDLERSVGHFAHVVHEVVERAGDVRRPLMLAGAGGGSRPVGVRALTSASGSGAGGGLGFAICALGGRLVDGADLFATVARTTERAEHADLVLTACAALDGASFHGSPTAVAVRSAAEWGVPCVAVAGTSMMSRRERAAAGLNAVVTLDEGRAPGVGGLRSGQAELAISAERLARTWSPGRVQGLGVTGPRVLGHS